MPAIDRVIVGVNDSPRNLPALRYAAALASSHFTPLFLVLAWGAAWRRVRRPGVFIAVAAPGMGEGRPRAAA